jgi:hypothetical protein
VPFAIVLTCSYECACTLKPHTLTDRTMLSTRSHQLPQRGRPQPSYQSGWQGPNHGYKDNRTLRAGSNPSISIGRGNRGPNDAEVADRDHMGFFTHGKRKAAVVEPVLGEPIIMRHNRGNMRGLTGDSKVTHINKRNSGEWTAGQPASHGWWNHYGSGDGSAASRRRQERRQVRRSVTPGRFRPLRTASPWHAELLTPPVGLN